MFYYCMYNYTTLLFDRINTVTTVWARLLEEGKLVVVVLAELTDRER